MAAITAAVNRQSKGTPKTRRYLMTNSITIPKGAIVSVPVGTGKAINAIVGTATDITVGIAAETVTSGTGGADWIQVEYDREYLFAATSITQLMVGTGMLIVDNNTVDETSGGTPPTIPVGKLTEFVSTTSGWVHVPGLSN